MTAALAILFFSLQNCTDPLQVGSELLDEDRASVGFTDTFELKMRTVIGDSVPVLRFFEIGETFNQFGFNNYLLGRTEDQFFGTTDCSFYFEPRVLRDDVFGDIIVPPFVRFPVVDSAFLIMPLDSAGSYGRLDGPYTVEVYEVTEPLLTDIMDDSTRVYYSNTTFATGALIGSTTFTPDFQDTMTIRPARSPSSQDTFDLRFPHLRVPLDLAWAQNFIEQDTSTFSSDEALLDFFKGVYVKAGAPTEGLLSFALNKGLFEATFGISGVYFYYRSGDDTLSYNLQVRNLGRRISNYRHDYSGSLAGAAIEDPTQDSLLFIQGLQGTVIALELPNVQNFTGKIINQAELELTVAAFPEYDTDFNRLVDQIVIYYLDEDGDEVEIADVDRQFGLDNFGGRLVEEDGQQFYTFNIGIHTQFLIDGSVPETLYLRTQTKGGNPARVIFKGPGAIENRAILKVSFTDL